MIRVVLPTHLRRLAGVDGEVALAIDGPITQRTILDALEARYPMLRGTIRDQATQRRRAFLRFFACAEDRSLDPPDTVLPDAIARGAEPFLIVGAIAGGSADAANRLAAGEADAPTFGASAPGGAPAEAGSALARPGAVSYLEIPTRDPAQSAGFAEQVFGWVVDWRGAQDVRFQDQAGQLLGRWVPDRPAAREAGLLPYVSVPSVGTALGQVEALGGAIVEARHREGNLVVATIRDPSGNLFGLWQFARASVDGSPPVDRMAER
jgi:molybdopterin synthase sulfur carrier subunit